MKKAFCIIFAGISIGITCPVLAGETGGQSGRSSGVEISSQPVVSPEAEDQKKDGKNIVAAWVNGTEVPLKSVLAIMNRLYSGQGAADGITEDKDAAIKNALNKAVFYELAYQKAKADGMKVEQAELDKQESELRARVGGAEALKNHLAEEMMTEEEMRALFERSVILKRIFASKVFYDVVISDDEIAAAYEKDKGIFIAPEKILVTDIVFFLEPEEDESVALAQEVLRKILDDGDMNPYNLVPDQTFIVHDVELNKENDKELCEAARKLKTGEVSGVIKTGDSLHIIKLKEYFPEKQFELNEVKGFVKQKLITEMQQKRSQEWEAELRKTAKIKLLDMDEIKKHAERLR